MSAILKARSLLLPSHRAIIFPRLVSSSTNSSSAASPEAVSVFISQSNDVFSNLALEDWLYKNFSFGRHNLLYLWRNRPCVVIGRHQNPWQEVSPGFLKDAASGAGGTVARRLSGGGSVYHDLGNINLTFFSSRDQYDRRGNLRLVADTLKRRWSLDVDVNNRDDIMMAGKYKISGTAAKLTRTAAYHHCTLLVDSDLSTLRQSLNTESDLESNATASVPCSVGNILAASAAPSISSTVNSATLALSIPALDVDAVVSAVGGAYLNQAGVGASRGFQLVNPSEDWFPGLGEIERLLRSSDWVYGRTPTFSHTFSLPSSAHVRVCVRVEKGCVTEAKLIPAEDGSAVVSDAGARSPLSSVRAELLSALVGLAYTSDIAQQTERVLLGGDATVAPSISTTSSQDNARRYDIDAGDIYNPPPQRSNYICL